MVIYEHYSNYEALRLFRSKIESNEVGKADMLAIHRRFDELFTECEALKTQYANHVNQYSDCECS